MAVVNVSKTKKVLVIDSDIVFQYALKSLLLSKLGNNLKVLQAFTIPEAERLFKENSDVDIIVVDNRVSGPQEDTVRLVKKIRRSYQGPIVADSFWPDSRKILVEAGCSHEISKFGVFYLLKQLLGR